MKEHELRAALREGAYEPTVDGLLLPKQHVIARGRFCYGKRGEPVEYSDNLLVDAGLDHMLNVVFRNATQMPTWYIAIFGGDVTVLGSWTAATFPGSATELTAYAEATRPAWTPTAASGGVVSSYTAKASFTANAAITIRGAALLSASAKGATTGTLMAASRFNSEKPLSDTEIIDIGYQIELTAT